MFFCFGVGQNTAGINSRFLYDQVEETFALKRVLITGHTGFLGQHLQRFFSDFSDYDIIKIDRNLSVDQRDLHRIMADDTADWIINLAANVGVKNSWKRPEEFIQQNNNLALHACELARLQNAKLLHISSYVYGSVNDNPIDEKRPTFATNPYMASKIISETLVTNYCSVFDIKHVILRPFNIFGPNQNVDFLIPALIKSGETGEPVGVLDYDSRRDYLHVNDFCSAVMAVVSQSRPVSGVFNIGSGKSHSVKEIIDLMKRCSIGVVTKNLNVVDTVRDCVANIDKFSDIYEWKPEICFEDGIKSLVSAEG